MLTLKKIIILKHLVIQNSVTIVYFSIVVILFSMNFKNSLGFPESQISLKKPLRKVFLAVKTLIFIHVLIDSMNIGRVLIQKLTKFDKKRASKNF